MTVGKGTAIGFIGIGVMGNGMVTNLIRSGFVLHVYNRTRAKAVDVIAQGAQWHGSIADLVAEVPVVITMVGYPHDVEEIYLADGGILHHARPGTFLVDMTTSSPALAQKIYREAQTRKLAALDAPVSGGDVGAREGRLSIMVGGDREAYQALLPVFEAMGSNIVFQGAAGSGQHTKLCNQIAIASNMMGVCEALAYAEKSGLNPANVLKSIESGAAGSWSLSNLGPRMMRGDFAPGFYVKHFLKDMAIALESAREMDFEPPGLALAQSLYQRLAAMGEEESGTQALYKLFGEDRGVRAIE